MGSIELLGVRIDQITKNQVIRLIGQAISNQQKTKVYYANIHAINLANIDPLFKKNLNQGDVVFCDGFGAKLGAWILGHSLGDRMTPPDWIDSLCDHLAEAGYSIFLLGDEHFVAEKCASLLKQRHQKLIVAGTHHGFFLKTGRENEKLIERINAVQPDLLIVGFGMPLQENWIEENASKLNAKVFFAVGALFRWYTGSDKRAPKFFTNNGFEWLFRLIVQPRKVWRRYIIGNPIFFLRILREKISSSLF